MAFGHRRCCFVLAVAGQAFSTGGVLLQEPLFSSSVKGSDNISIINLPVYAYFFLLNPLTFYLNMFLVLRHVTTHTAGAPGSHIPVFLLNHLPRAAHAVSFATLLFGMPLWIQAAVIEENVGMAIGAMLKILVSGCHSCGNSVPALLAVCVSTGFLFFDPILSFSNTNHYDLLIHTSHHYLLLFVIFVIFILGTLLILRISAPADTPQAAIQAEHLAIVALSVAFAILLVAAYMKAYAAVADVAVVAVEAAEKQKWGL